MVRNAAYFSRAYKFHASISRFMLISARYHKKDPDVFSNNRKFRDNHAVDWLVPSFVEQ